MRCKPEKGPQERGTMEWRKKKFSTVADASNCQAGTPGSFPKYPTFGEEAGGGFSSCMPLWRNKPTKTEELQPARFSSLQMSTFFGTGQRAHHQSSDVKMSLMDHPEAVRPTGPMCGNLRPGAASKPTTSNGKSLRGEILAETCAKEPRHDCVATSCSNCATSSGGTNIWPERWRSTIGATTRSGGPAQGCAQTGLNARQSSCGARNARTQGGRWESPTCGGPEPQAHHLHTTPEHRGSTTCAAAAN